MLYEVRILNPDMKIKKTISRGELVKRFWQQFYMGEKNHSLISPSRNGVSSKVKKQLMNQFPEVYDLTYLNH